ncbi:MAG TPA: hypothetical protein VLX28_05070 [Thermoanaerobaculia bacterium]|nr:hypothetical protein [Thermoanaerobaculia bacterium]
MSVLFWGFVEMSSLKKVVLGTLLATAVLTLMHAWLNLGFDPLRFVGLKKKAVVEEARFRVGFLPVT